MEVREGVYYAKVMKVGFREKKKMSSCLMNFTSEEGEKTRLSKAFVGEVLNPGSSYNVQTQSEVEGIFSIKVTPMGANLCLLEDVEDDFISELISEGST